MKIKVLFASLLFAACAIASQAQGYMDGIEFYKIGQLGNAKETAHPTWPRLRTTLTRVWPPTPRTPSTMWDWVP